MVVDLMKFEIIYQNGGIYLDKNVELFKSLDHLTNFRLFSGR
jgi:mannosyltransferase OCH1-like enzyme